MALTSYDVLRRPLITEKTNFHVNKLHQYVFEVAGGSFPAHPRPGGIAR